MRKSLLLNLFVILCFLSKAQTFSNNTSTSIPDVNATIEIPINVSGLPTALNTGFGLTNVCLNLTHPFIGELTIVLKAPTGADSVRLLWHDGGNIAINGGICLTEAATQFIAAYHAGGITDYYGEEDNNIMNNSRNPNGTWILRITDVIPTNAGMFNSAAITFGNNPPPTHSRVFGCTLNSPWGCHCPDGTNDCDLLPDMTNAEVALSSNLQQTAGQIRFSVATPNIGAGPLEMNGSTTECFCDGTPVPCGTVCPTGQELKHNVYQKIYHRSGNGMTNYTRAAGQMGYHPTHNHIHVDHWTNNTLRIKTLDPNPTHWPILDSAYKVSYCLVNLGSCNSYAGYCKDRQGNVLTNASISNYNFGVNSGCGLNQGIYPGRVDQYGSSMIGQTIDVSNYCNGTYYLVSITDPDNNVLETDETNNWAAIPIHLTMQGNCCHTSFYADTLHGVDSLRVQFSDSTIAIPIQWHWDFGDGYTSDQQFPQHLYSAPGTYTVVLATMSETGCKDTMRKVDYLKITRSPTPDPINSILVSVAPNPFKDQLVIRFSTPAGMNINLLMYDAVGRKVHAENINVPAGSSLFRLSPSVAGLSAGVYYMKIKSEAGYSQVFKLIKR